MQPGGELLNVVLDLLESVRAQSSNTSSRRVEVNRRAPIGPAFNPL